MAEKMRYKHEQKIQRKSSKHHWTYRLLLPAGVLCGIVIILLMSINLYSNFEVTFLRSELNSVKMEIELLKQQLQLDLMDENNQVGYGEHENEDALTYEEYFTLLKQDEEDEEDEDQEDQVLYDILDDTMLSTHEEYPRLERQKRDGKSNAGSNAEAPTTRKPKRRGKKNRKGKNKNGNSRRNNEVSLKNTSAHFIPMHDPKEYSGEKTVHCGYLTRQGLRVHCEVSNFWNLDSESINTQIVDLVNGVAVVKVPGTYYVYAQVTHHDVLGSWSYGISRAKKGSREVESLLQCPGMEPHFHTNNHTEKVYPVQFQCHSGRAVRLEVDDQISLRNLYFHHENRVVKMDKHLTFWGLIRTGN